MSSQKKVLSPSNYSAKQELKKQNKQMLLLRVENSSYINQNQALKEKLKKMEMDNLRLQKNLEKMSEDHKKEKAALIKEHEKKIDYYENSDVSKLIADRDQFHTAAKNKIIDEYNHYVDHLKKQHQANVMVLGNRLAEIKSIYVNLCVMKNHHKIKRFEKMFYEKLCIKDEKYQRGVVPRSTC